MKKHSGKSWKRFLAVGCNHGNLADPEALKAVLKFKRALKPHTVIHLGDFCDMTALRSGARGSKDEAVSLFDDVAAGTRFLEQLEPTHIFVGNHDDRAYKLLDHPNAQVAYCAGRLVHDVEDLAKKLRADLVPYHIEKGWRYFGDTGFGHGYMFNQMAVRDHAEMFGKCVIAHLHRAEEAHGRRLGGPTCTCAGFLGLKDLFSYAKINRNITTWSQGLVHGEYNDAYCHVRLEKKTPFGWRLPL